MLFGVDFAAAAGLPAQPSVLRTPFAMRRTSGLHDRAYNGSCLHVERRTRLHFDAVVDVVAAVARDCRGNLWFLLWCWCRLR